MPAAVTGRSSRIVVALAAVLALTASLLIGLSAATAVPAGAASGNVAVMNLRFGKNNSDVKRYQKALRAYAPKVGVSATKLNPAGATGYYGNETMALTKAVYKAVAKKTGDQAWAEGEIRFPGKGLIHRIGLGVTTTPFGIDDVRGSTRLITVEGAHMGSTTGTLVMWRLSAGKWAKVASYPARFGANGIVAGSTRRQNTNTTPSGLYSIPFAFGTAPDPGTSMRWRHVTKTAWWCEDVKSSSYNRWVDPIPTGCRKSESEHLVTYKTYNYGAVIGFNYADPIKGRGAGIFLHTNGKGLTAGCVSISTDGMKRVLRWLTPASNPHIAIGSSASLVDL
jgi:L,D-peptidoglycan transpeptidase YkuD (ErfK/YbiS/YcfS/YnhG family)